MMGYGSYGNWGYSSSSSNLSALAPPFTVGRTVSKPNSNPHANLINELPPPSGATYSWVPSNPTSVPDYYGDYNSIADLIHPPSVSSYLVPLPDSSPDTRMPPLDAGAINATGAFSYGQYTDSVTTAVDDAKPYYPYVSPSMQEKNPLVGDSTYDLLSACSLAPMVGTPQDDYPKSLSGWESSTRWDGSWNELRYLESGKCTNSDCCFDSTEPIFASPPRCQDYVKPGPSNLGSVSTSVSPGTPRQETSLESITNSSSNLTPYNAKYDLCLRQHDTCPENFTSALKSSPSHVVKPPAVGAYSSQLNMISFQNWNCDGTDVAGQNEDFSHRRLSSLNNPHLGLSSVGNEVCSNPSRFSIDLERSGQDVADTSSRGALSSKEYITKDAFNYLSQATELHVLQTSSPDRFPLLLDEAKANDSVEYSSKSSDPYNTAEDSPCWKGATSPRFSPFDVSEAVAPQHLVERSESCSGSSLHGPQMLPILSNDAVRDISQKLTKIFQDKQNRSRENGLSPSINRHSIATYSYGEHRLNSAKAGSLIPEQSCDGVHFSNTVEASKKEPAPALSNNKKIDPYHRPSNTMKPLLQEVSFTSEKCLSGFRFAETEMNPNDASENGPSHVPIHTTEDVLSSLCGENALSKLTKLRGEESTPKIDVPVLVKTMHNLSDLLLFYCSSDACALKEQDHVSLKHVINNLSACSLKSPQLTLKGNSVFSPQGTTHFLGESPDLHQGASVDSVHVTEIAAANAMDEPDTRRIHEEKRHNILPGSKHEKFRDLAPVHNDADIVKTDVMTQVIKKVLIENFHGEEETHAQVLLYKNLWLEAEALICSTSLRGRFDRMKNEMEKCKPHEAKDVSENMMDVENVSNSKVYPDVITVNKLDSDTQSGIQDSPITSTTSHAADVVARFHMLKCRGDNSTSMNTEDAVKGPSSKVFPDLKVVPLARDSLASEIKTSDADEVDYSVMARFRILKCRVDNSSSTDMGGEQQVPGVVDLGFADKREHSPNTRDGSVMDGMFNMTIGHDLQHPIDDCTEHKLMTINETSLCGNDTVIQSCGTDKLGNQQSPGWYDSASLDWEHVLKDDFAWQN